MGYSHDNATVHICKASSSSGPFVDAVGRRYDQSGGTLVLGNHGDLYAPGGQGILLDEQTKRLLSLLWAGSKAVGQGY